MVDGVIETYPLSLKALTFSNIALYEPPVPSTTIPSPFPGTSSFFL